MTPRLAAATLAIGVAVTAGRVAAQAPAPDPAALWTYMAQTIASELQPRVASFVGEEQRARVTATRVATAVSTNEPRCRYPARLTFSEPTETGYRIVTCANNLRAMQFANRETLKIMLAPPDLRDNEEIWGRYFTYFAGYLHRHRADDLSAIPYPCTIKYYVYLIETDAPESRCEDNSETGNAAFEAWLTAHNNLVWPPILAALRAAPPFSGFDDAQTLAGLEVLYVLPSTIATIMFAVLHEYGHVANGDFERLARDRCERLQQEAAADEFAVRYLTQIGMNRRADLSVAQLPWFFFGSAVRSLSAIEPQDEELALVRARTIIQSLQSDSAARAEGFPEQTIRALMERAQHDPILRESLREIDQRARCS